MNQNSHCYSQPTTPKDMHSRRLRCLNEIYMHFIPLDDVDMHSRRLRCLNELYMHFIPLDGVDDLCLTLPTCNVLIWNQLVQTKEKPWIRPLQSLDWEDRENKSISYLFASIVRCVIVGFCAWWQIEHTQYYRYTLRTAAIPPAV